MNQYIKAFLLLTPLIFSSCIKDEELDTNADILEAYIPSEYLKTDPIITNTSVEFRVKANVDLEKQTPFFIISPNATMDPPNGTTRDFRNSQEVIITAQDQSWKKKYIVSFTSDELSTLYTFNNAELTNKNRYYRFYEIGSNGDKIHDWDSGNEGYSTVAGNTPPEGYPTTIAPGRRGGLSVKMQTVYTSKTGQIAGNPIAAGNLFLGTFKLNPLFPIKSTKFGLPYTGELPTSLRGSFKYTAGKIVTDSNYNEIPGAKDTFDIYAILFETQKKNNFLAGDHAFKDPRNVAIARIEAKDRIETNLWTEFNVPFVLVPGKTYDPQKDYILAIVMTSSIDGADFKGAVGSTLLVDEIELVYEKDNKE
ncbi:PCMD domain-containing protein [Myroides odoratimimus]|uniref:PCMD domain-containing protein n=1 Tax=Myroides odoratimimus TaxID=76832 RepID=UPI002574BF48|nr:PCMD domain-containing protein [Myroides odoratimimus]MDM1396787.1 PCMD domain-containing protein [Myroides odoratimimus]